MTPESRLQVGVDVPWVTSWSEEPMTGVAPCPSVDGVLAVGQVERPGVGRPLYSRNHLFRQRKSVREMLCPMCGKPTANDDRWSQTGHWTTAGAVRAKNMGVWIPPDMADSHRLFDSGAIAPLHRACADRALMYCPHLKGMADRELKAFPDAWLIATLTVEARPQAVYSNLPIRSVPAVTFLQLIGVPDYDG
ncbi:hypothetical protein [Phenylobacterium sp.]|uniref:hypothetical protein n=1 Tax=Phenylobacterium sp. TaxID=1871053 RepID=UPI0011FE79F6|nr:hypothetical protein [Phenylobacterium sp.]THD58618.1 MAG: hypothetical protein E8A49_19040 [Phenylobacterium sp.]